MSLRSGSTTTRTPNVKPILFLRNVVSSRHFVSHSSSWEFRFYFIITTILNVRFSQTHSCSLEEENKSSCFITGGTYFQSNTVKLKYTIITRKQTLQRGWYGGNVVVLYPVGTEFENQPWHLQVWARFSCFFFSSSAKILRQHLQSGNSQPSSNAFQIIIHCHPNMRSHMVWPTHSVIK